MTLLTSCQIYIYVNCLRNTSAKMQNFPPLLYFAFNRTDCQPLYLMTTLNRHVYSILPFTFMAYCSCYNILGVLVEYSGGAYVFGFNLFQLQQKKTFILHLETILRASCSHHRMTRGNYYLRLIDLRCI